MRKLFALTLLILGAFVLLGAQGLTLGKGATYGKGMTISPGSAASAPSIDNTCNSGNPVSAASFTCTMTISASSKEVLVWTMAFGGSTDHVGAGTVTVGACSASQTTKIWETAGANGIAMDLYQCTTPPSGSTVITVTPNISTVVSFAAISIIGGTGTIGPPVCPSACGAIQTSTGNPSLAVSSSTSSLVFDGVAVDLGGACSTWTKGASQTLVSGWSNLCTTADFNTSGSTQPGAASITMSWTDTSGANYLQIAVSIS